MQNFWQQGIQRNCGQGMQSFLFFRASPEEQKMRFAGNYSGFYELIFAKKLMTYHLVHQFHRDGFSIAYIRGAFCFRLAHG
jgi:hypothetical protein